MRTLIVGCDASGKTTMLNEIHGVYGDFAFESTSSPEVQSFKLENVDHKIDDDFIDRREALFLKLSEIALHLSIEHRNTASTDSSLVTRLSHDTMRRLIKGNKNYLSDDDIIELWSRDEESLDAPKPDIFVHTFADIQTIYRRIEARQGKGVPTEQFSGFNSKYFLDMYQERWLSMIDSLARASFNCLSINTDLTSVDVAIKRYHVIRDDIE